MTTAEGNITNLQGRMTTAESNIGNLQTAVSTAQATANSAQQTATTARQQSYVFRYSSTALTPSSTNSNTLLDNTDNLKVGDKVIDSSGVLFSVTAIDTQNSTFTIGTALIDLAQDSDVVHTNRNDDVNIPLNSTSAELGITGGSTNITFLDKNDKKLSSLTLGNYGSSKLSYARLNIFDKDTNNNEIQDTLEYAYVSNNNNAYLRVSRDNFCTLGTTSYRWKGIYATSYYYGSNNVEFSTKFVTTDTAQTISETKTFTNTIKSQKEIELTGSRLAYILPEFSAGYSGLSLCTYSSSGAVRIGIWKVDDNDNTKHVLNDSLGYLNITTGSVNSVNIVYLTPRNASKAKLGDSTNKWKEINGITPSSLGMPSDRSARVDISGYFTNMASGDTNTYTAPSNGWIYLSLDDVTEVNLESQTSGGLTNYGDYRSRSSNGALLCLFPVRKDDVFVSQWYTTTTVTVTNAYFIPCQGNI